jgi:tetratricopeptide (TPR) repeat protein
MAFDDQHFAAATRFWADAFASDPKLAAGGDAQRLYHAARTAILAAERKGKDAPAGGDHARARFRAQALDWLNAVLAVWNKVAASSTSHDRIALIRAMLEWKTDPNLAPVRDPEPLKKLPADEQKAWRTLWSRFDATLKADDCWAHTHLGEALSAEGKREEAAAEFRKAVQLAPHDGVTCWLTAVIMRDQGHIDPAVELFGRAARWDRENNKSTGLAIWALAEIQRSLGRYDEAVTSYRRIREFPHATPDDLRKAAEEIALTEAHRRSHAARAAALAGSNQEQGNGPLDDATRAGLRAQAREWFTTELANLTMSQWAGSGEGKASVTRILEFWRSIPDLAGVRDGEALKRLPLGEQNGWRLFWAEIEILLHPGDPLARPHLVEALNAIGKRQDAGAEFRRVARLAPYDGWTCFTRALAVRDQGHNGPAIDLLRRALQWDIETKRDNPGAAVWELAHTLRMDGRFDESVATYRRLWELDGVGPNEIRGADREITETESERAMMNRLTEVVKGKAPADQTEAAALAQFASIRARYGVAARLWSFALAGNAKVSDGHDDHRRYDAARSAALAGCGKSRDDPPPNDAAMAKLRAQALEWLKAELHDWFEALEQKPPGQGKSVERVMTYWKNELDLAGVRDADALAKLPDSERQAWQKLWSEVDALNRKAQGKSPESVTQPGK